MNRILLPLAAMALLAAFVAPLPTTAAATTHTVLVSSFAYTPDVLQVAVGDTVQFVIVDACHTVTEGIVIAPIPGGFDSGVRCLGDFEDNVIATITFTEPIVFRYFCAVGTHALLGMQGTIVAL